MNTMHYLMAIDFTNVKLIVIRTRILKKFKNEVGSRDLLHTHIKSKEASQNT